MSKNAQPQTVSFKLNQAHTHAGQAYKKDDVIQVRPETAQRLLKKKKGEIVK